MTGTQRWIMVAVILASGIVFLDSTVVNVASPSIAEDFESSLLSDYEAQNYVYNGYLLTLSALLILAGALADYYGRKRMFLVGLVGFALTSLACGLAPNFEALIGFRLLQGAAGALLVPGSLAIINTSFAGEERGRAFGFWAGASAATTILGPFIGGLLVDTISWRAAFLINPPLIALAAWATLRHVPESRDEEMAPRFDWAGSAIVALAVGGLAFGAIRGVQKQWADATAFAALGIGAVAALLLPIYMMRRRHPQIPPSLFRSRNFTVTNISTFLIYGALYVTFFNMGVFVQGSLRYDAAAAGLMGIPGTLFLALFSTRFGKLATRYGPRLFMAVGPAIMALGVLLFARVPASSAPWRFGTSEGRSILPPTDYWVDFLPGQVLFGIGLMIMVAPLTAALMSSVPEHNSGVASAINNAISRVGPQLAGAVLFIAIAGTFYGGLAERVPGLDARGKEFREDVAPLNRPAPDLEFTLHDGTTISGRELAEPARVASTEGFHLAMLMSAALLIAGAAVNAVGIRNPARGRPGEADPAHTSPSGAPSVPVAQEHPGIPAPAGDDDVEER